LYSPQLTTLAAAEKRSCIFCHVIVANR